MRREANIGVITCVILSLTTAGQAQLTPTPTPLGPNRFHILVLDGFGGVHHRSAPIPTPTPPQQLTVMLPGDVRMEMVLIPAGSFWMGRYPGEQLSLSCEDPQHQVTIGSDFYVGKYEVTKAQWEAVMGTRPWTEGFDVLDDPNSPAVYISWNDVQPFIMALNQLGQGTFRLPSEAEWEYACRAGTTTRFYWGDDPDYTQIGKYAWYIKNACHADEEYAHVVGLKLPNAWGLYDMIGNVWELCQDYWHVDYSGAPADGSAWELPTSSYRVIRGSSWHNAAQSCRSAARNRLSPDSGYVISCIGVRVVRTR